MPSHIDKTVEDFKARIVKSTEELNKLKETVNLLLTTSGKPPAYKLEEEVSDGDLSFRSDQFYRAPLATAVRSILEARRSAGIGPATVNDIYQSLTQGGYDFSNKRHDINKRTLSISMAKNTYVFHKLPNGQFGLAEWYGVKDAKTKVASENGKDQQKNGQGESGSETVEKEEVSSKEK